MVIAADFAARHGLWPALLSCCLLAPSAHADPQYTAALRPGLAGAGSRDALWDHTAFYGALYGDLLLGRASSNDAGVGPFLDCATVGFSDLRLSAGPTVLLPLASLVTQVSLGGTWVPTSPAGYGLHGQLFLGGRGYNYHADYSPAIGLVLGADYGLGGRRALTFSAALSLDLEYLALPFLILYGSLRSTD